jgi:hypothetical protein
MTHRITREEHTICSFPTPNQFSSGWWHNTEPCARFVSHRSALCFSLAVTCGQVTLAALQTLRYTIMSNGRTAGSRSGRLRSRRSHVDSTFEYNDRGRGPKITAHYIVAADGSPVAHGHNRQRLLEGSR